MRYAPEGMVAGYDPVRAWSRCLLGGRLQIVSTTGGDARGLGRATEPAENRAPATEVSRHRSFLKCTDAGSIPAASTISGLSEAGAEGKSPLALRYLPPVVAHGSRAFLWQGECP